MPRKAGLNTLCTFNVERDQDHFIEVVADVYAQNCRLAPLFIVGSMLGSRTVCVTKCPTLLPILPPHCREQLWWEPMAEYGELPSILRERSGEITCAVTPIADFVKTSVQRYIRLKE